jgi:hypothetical protein
VKNWYCKLSLYSILGLSCLLFHCKKEIPANDDSDKEVLKIGEAIFFKKDFDKYYQTLDTTELSGEARLKKTLAAFYRKALISNYLSQSKYQINEEEKNNLLYKNKLDLIELAIERTTTKIEVSESEVKEELEKFDQKQVVADVIYLPAKNDSLLSECFSFLNSGGTIIDLINYKRDIFNKIFYINKGVVKRVIVEPGTFLGETSNFLANSNAGDTKIIENGSGYYILKTIYKSSDPFARINREKIIQNIKRAKYFGGKSIFEKLLKKEDLYCNYDLINELDFTIPPLLTEDTSIIGEFDGKKIYTRDVVQEINNLPFKDKLYFSNSSTRPTALATFILLKNFDKPFTTDHFLTEFYQTNDLMRDKKDSYSPLFKQSLDETLASLEFNHFKTIEKSSIYPWLFPELFKSNNKVKINYDNVYNVNLVKIIPFDTTDVLASSGKHVLKVSDFFNQLKNLTVNTLSNILEIDNSIRLIHYHFNEEYNVPENEVRINMPLLKNAILDFSRTLQIHSFIYNVTFMEPTSKKRIGYKDDPIVLKFGTRNINISALRNIIAQLPHKKQLMFKYDNEGVNRYWRLNVLNEIIEQEIWLKEAEEMGLANSDEYKTLAKVNESNAVLNSFLNSLRTQNIDAVNGRLSKIIKNASPKLSSSYDATYFKNQEHVLKNFLDNPSTN